MWTSVTAEVVEERFEVCNVTFNVESLFYNNETTQSLCAAGVISQLIN